MKFAYEDLSDDQFKSLNVFLCQRLLGMNRPGNRRHPEALNIGFYGRCHDR